MGDLIQFPGKQGQKEPRVVVPFERAGRPVRSKVQGIRKGRLAHIRSHFKFASDKLLRRAAENGDTRLLRYCLDKKTQDLAKPEYIRLISIACDNQDIDTIALLVEKSDVFEGMDTVEADDEWWIHDDALNLSITKGRLDVCQAIMEKFYTQEIPFIVFGDALFHAVQGGREAFFEYFMDNKSSQAPWYSFNKALEHCQQTGMDDKAAQIAAVQQARRQEKTAKIKHN